MLHVFLINGNRFQIKVNHIIQFLYEVLMEDFFG
jgi:hypothetical protein